LDFLTNSKGWKYPKKGKIMFGFKYTESASLARGPVKITHTCLQEPVD
jgi:hypothetical protein